jgi:hypothetical protein
LCFGWPIPSFDVVLFTSFAPWEMKFLLVGASFALFAFSKAAPSGQCPAGDLDIEVETVWVTVTAGQEDVGPTPSTPLATVTPTSCNKCGHTLVGPMPQYQATEFCATATIHNGVVVTGTFCSGTTRTVNTICTVDGNGNTESLASVTTTYSSFRLCLISGLPAKISRSQLNCRLVVHGIRLNFRNGR